MRLITPILWRKQMWKNKNNGKIVTNVVFERGRVYFKIDGLKESLAQEVFEHHYEKCDASL